MVDDLENADAKPPYQPDTQKSVGLCEALHPNGGAIGSPVALTQGSAGLDFAVSSGETSVETCTAETSYGIGAPCTVAVTFTPKAAGLRSGAVLLRDGSGNTIATAYVHGSGSGPQVGNTTYAAATPVSDTFTVSQWTSIAPGALLFVPMTPCRLADTRNPIGPFGSPSIAGGTSRSFVIPNSDCGVPSTAAAYSVNVTGEAQPNTSTLNSDGRVKANAAIVPAGTNGAISIYASNTTDLVLDINGYFVPATSTSALAFYALTPCRIADTRNPRCTLGRAVAGR